jgi:hypothetical protein
MPAYPVLVFEKETGTPTYMHSVDAREAVQLGDYEYKATQEHDLDPEERAAARAKFQGGMAVLHPELQSEEERQQHRDEANEKAALTAAIPEGAQVVVMAPSREARSRATPASSPAPPPPAPPPTGRQGEEPHPPARRTGG